MSKKVVLVGHCGPDSSYLRMAVSRASKGISVLSADDQDDLSKVLTKDTPDLLLLNRELPYGFEETFGVDLIRALRPVQAVPDNPDEVGDDNQPVKCSH